MESRAEAAEAANQVLQQHTQQLDERIQAAEKDERAKKLGENSFLIVLTTQPPRSLNLLLGPVSRFKVNLRSRFGCPVWFNHHSAQ